MNIRATGWVIHFAICPGFDSRTVEVSSRWIAISKAEAVPGSHLCRFIALSFPLPSRKNSAWALIWSNTLACIFGSSPRDIRRWSIMAVDQLGDAAHVHVAGHVALHPLAGIEPSIPQLGEVALGHLLECRPGLLDVGRSLCSDVGVNLPNVVNDLPLPLPERSTAPQDTDLGFLR